MLFRVCLMSPLLSSRINWILELASVPALDAAFIGPSSSCSFACSCCSVNCWAFPGNNETTGKMKNTIYLRIHKNKDSLSLPRKLSFASGGWNRQSRETSQSTTPRLPRPFLEAVLPLLNPLGHCCHIIAISIIRLTLHLVSANSSHTALSPYLPPLPSQPAFVPYPFASRCLKFDFQCKAVWDMLTSCCLSRIPIAFPRWAMPGFELEGLGDCQHIPRKHKLFVRTYKQGLC